MKKLRLELILLLFLGACSSKRKMVNPPTDGAPIVPFANVSSPNSSPPTAVGTESNNNIYLAAPNAGLSGKIFFKAQMPFPLANVQLRLNKIENKNVLQILEFNTDRDGSFVITRPLEKGEYQLIVIDPRYRGDFKISLTDGPLLNLIFEIEKK